MSILPYKGLSLYEVEGNDFPFHKIRFIKAMRSISPQNKLLIVNFYLLSANNVNRGHYKSIEERQNKFKAMNYHAFS